MFERIDAIVEGVDVLTRGTNKAVSTDWKHVDEEEFTMSGATFSLFQDDLTPVAAIQERVATITTSPKGDARAFAVITGPESLALTAGMYFGLWKLAFADAQTRWARGSIRVRTVP